jgi:hypothetical protein
MRCSARALNLIYGAFADVASHCNQNKRRRIISRFVYTTPERVPTQYPTSRNFSKDEIPTYCFLLYYLYSTLSMRETYCTPSTSRLYSLSTYVHKVLWRWPPTQRQKMRQASLSRHSSLLHTQSEMYEMAVLKN